MTFPQSSLPPQAVLIVDDNPTNLSVLSESLSNAGFRVAVATDGESALKQIKYRQPELILLDVMMPGIDGFETCRRLKADPVTHDIPIIFMTALADTENKVRGLSLGAVDYITKPFQQDEALARVKAHSQLRSFAKTLAEQNQQLTAQKTELSEALNQLQKTQTQMLQTEKMSSLGQLVAGVAHEINNPVTFISGNLIPTRDYVQGLFKLIGLYQKHYPNPTDEIQTELEAIDLNFVTEDLPKLLVSMKTGADRIRKIVLSLRNFSRLDESECKAVDIHEGIDNTLMILGHRLSLKPNRPEIQVVREYGNLPQVECHVGEINQVYMNILNNAIDALEPTLNHPIACPEIRIRTELDEFQQIVIHITDNGIGIAKEIQPRIFDPFFTTKPIGQGTGMGLSTSYQIVEQQHGGSLTCVSTPQHGTELTIKLPLRKVNV
jgi:two-component system, NtrC family, sensor kinase